MEGLWSEKAILTQIYKNEPIWQLFFHILFIKFFLWFKREKKWKSFSNKLYIEKHLYILHQPSLNCFQLNMPDNVSIIRPPLFKSSSCVHPHAESEMDATLLSWSYSFLLLSAVRNVD